MTLLHLRENGASSAGIVRTAQLTEVTLPVWHLRGFQGQRNSILERRTVFAVREHVPLFISSHLRTCYFRVCSRRGSLFPAQHPHPRKLNNVCIYEEELRSSIPLRPCNCIGCPASHCANIARRIREKDIF
jgi:hypothetical protein